MSDLEHHKKISAIVVTYNSEKHILSSLKSLFEELLPLNGEINIFDNNSTDSTIAAVKAKFPEIKLIQSARNIGFARACNAAVRDATGEYLLFVNPDLILDPGAIRAMLQVFKNYPKAGAVVPRIRNSDDSFQSTCRNLPTIHNMIFSRKSMVPISKAMNQYTLPDSESIKEVPAAAATCLMIKKEIFDRLNGFDERFFMFMEDSDLSLRIGQIGRHIYFVPEAGAVHHWGCGSSVSRITRSRYHHISVWKYFLKHYPNGFSLFLLPLLLILNFLISAVVGLRDKNSR